MLTIINNKPNHNVKNTSADVFVLAIAQCN